MHASLGHAVLPQKMPKKGSAYGLLGQARTLRAAASGGQWAGCVGPFSKSLPWKLRPAAGLKKTHPKRPQAPAIKNLIPDMTSPCSAVVCSLFCGEMADCLDAACSPLRMDRLRELSHHTSVQQMDALLLPQQLGLKLAK